MPSGSLSSVVLPLAAVYGLLVLLAFAGQERMVFLPFGTVDSTPAQIGLPYEDVWLQTVDGERLHGWLIPHPEPRGVLLFLHGNAGNISHRLDSIAIFHELRLSVFIIDYRGYGNSTGRASEQGVYRDAEAARDFLVHERHVPPQRIIYFGRSLGAAVAAWLAARHPPQALILESAFTSAPDLGAELYPFLPVRLLARLELDTAAQLGGIERPVLIIHSRDDEIIPFAHAQRLSALVRGPVEFVELRGDHNHGFLLSGQHYRDGLDGFLTRYLE